MTCAAPELPRLLDVGCCAGGGAWGYHLAGLKVTGVDVVPQPNYPFEFIQADGLEFLADPANLEPFDAIHCSWPCQKWARASRHNGRVYPDLVTPGRKLLQAQPRPWIMENVPDSPLRPDVVLCGCYFDLELPGTGQLIRARAFETSWGASVALPAHDHHAPAISIAGHGTPSWARARTGHIRVADWREVMGITWTNRAELAEAIPPAYTKFMGALLLDVLAGTAAAAA